MSKVKFLHILRNSYGYSRATIRQARLDVCDAYESAYKELEAKDKLITEFRDRLTKQHVNFLNDFFYEIENGIVFKEDFIVQLKKLEQLLTNKEGE